MAKMIKNGRVGNFEDDMVAQAEAYGWSPHPDEEVPASEPAPDEVDGDAALIDEPEAKKRR